ncbi:hypothetical protein ADL19_12365 [Streptomyces purpurogeneiscleroticus]|nr:hypothetical protein ADL19_12365 [Streptomyces purpurogeneiscleroticus]
MSRDDNDYPRGTLSFVTQKTFFKSIRSNPELNSVLLFILVHLAISEDGATPSELCQEYEIDMAQMSKYLRTLRDGGFVHPVSEEKDARSKRYYNTLKGSDAAAAHLRRTGHNLEGKDLPHVAVKPVQVKGS